MTPKQREFLRAAIEDGGRVFKSDVPIYYQPYWHAGEIKLRSSWGDDLRKKRLIAPVIKPSGVGTVSWDRGYLYQITDAGREAV